MVCAPPGLLFTSNKYARSRTGGSSHPSPHGEVQIDFTQSLGSWGELVDAAFAFAVQSHFFAQSCGVAGSASASAGTAAKERAATKEAMIRRIVNLHAGL